MTVSGQKVTFGVTFRVTLGTTPSDFEFFGVSAGLGGQDFLKSGLSNQAEVKLRAGEAAFSFRFSTSALPDCCSLLIQVQ